MLITLFFWRGLNWICYVCDRLLGVILWHTQIDDGSAFLQEVGRELSLDFSVKRDYANHGWLGFSALQRTILIAFSAYAVSCGPFLICLWLMQHLHAPCSSDTSVLSPGALIPDSVFSPHPDDATCSQLPLNNCLPWDSVEAYSVFPVQAHQCIIPGKEPSSSGGKPCFC